MSILRTRRTLELLTVGAVWLCAVQSQAEPGPKLATSDRVTAQVLFDKGKERLVAGSYGEACPLLDESHRLVPGIGVLMHLALCLEKSNQLAAAWAAFQEAADRARAEGDAERASVAQSRASQLQGKLSFLTLRIRAGSTEIKTGAKHPDGFRIRRNGKPVSTAALGLEIPIDPGQHQIVVAADAMQESTRSVTLTEGEHTTLEVELIPLPVEQKPLPLAQPQPSARVVAAPAKVHDKSPARDSARSNRWDWAAWTTAGVGAAGLAVGATSGILAYSQMHDARAHCAGHATDDCPDDATQLQESARTSATVSTVAFAAGLGCLAIAGGYWLVTKSGRTAVAGWVSPTTSVLAVHSRW